MTKARFKTALEWQLGRLLAIAPRTQSELIDLTGADKKTIRKVLIDLDDRQVVTFHPSATGHVGRGHPRGMWSLRGDPPDRPFGEQGVPSGFAQAWRPGQIWVAATAPSSRHVDLLNVLAEAELTAAASWVAQLDGDGRTLFVAFESQLGSQPADRLMIAFRAAGVECTGGTVRALDDPETTSSQARSVLERMAPPGAGAPTQH